VCGDDHLPLSEAPRTLDVANGFPWRHSQHSPQAVPSSSSSSASDPFSLATPGLFCAALGCLAGRSSSTCRLLLAMLRVPVDIRPTLVHCVHVAGCFRCHSCGGIPARSFRTLHLRHSLHRMTERTRYHQPSSPYSGISSAKCSFGTRKTSVPAAVRPPAQRADQCRLAAVSVRSSLRPDLRLPPPNLC